ncbi:MAG: alpha/beta hydrolase-fold protein [Pseudomonadota bacterium]
MRKWLAAGAALLAVLGALLLWGLHEHALPLSELKPLAQSANGERYILYVRKPAACTSANPCPAVYVLDGAWLIGPYEHIAEQAEQSGPARPVILVGIGYQNIAATGSLRKRDFTPTFGHAANARTGGADAFLAVLERQIIPYAEAHYPIDRASRGLVAHSYAGLFATYVLARSPHLFDRCVIISPALWFRDYAVMREHFPTLDARIALFSDTPAEGQSDMARDVLRLRDALQSAGSKQVTAEIIPGTTHMSVPQIALARVHPALYPAR